MEGYGPENLRIDDGDSCLRTAEGITACDITLEWKEPVKVRRVVLKENLNYSQRIENFEIEVWQDGEFRSVYQGTVVGYQRIAVMEELCTDRLRVRILDARVSPAISFLGIY